MLSEAVRNETEKKKQHNVAGGKLKPELASASPPRFIFTIFRNIRFNISACLSICLLLRRVHDCLPVPFFPSFLSFSLQRRMEQLPWMQKERDRGLDCLKSLLILQLSCVCSSIPASVKRHNKRWRYGFVTVSP